MRRSSIILAISAFALAPAAATAGLTLPRLSPRASSSVTIGLTEVVIAYGRPGVKGREVWGGLVPYDQVWRAGANEATTISFSHDVAIDGHPLPRGRYSLQMIPRRGDWTIIFNQDADQWGAFNYDPAKDALRIQVKPTRTEHGEWLTFSFPQMTRTSAQVVLHWERREVAFTITTNTVADALANIERELARADPTGWRDRYEAAEFCYNYDVHLERALGWIAESIAGNENFVNLRLRARLLAKAGDLQAAVEAADAALEAGSSGESGLDADAFARDVEAWRRQLKQAPRP